MNGLFWELNPGPLAPEARIIPLDQQAIKNQKACSKRPAMSFYYMNNILKRGFSVKKLVQGLVRESNPGPLAP